MNRFEGDLTNPRIIEIGRPIQEAESLVVLIPVFNDWAAFRLLLPRIDASLAAADLEANVIIVDDASTVASGGAFDEVKLGAVKSVDVLRLRRNLGHQRAIAIGLTYAHKEFPNSRVLIMDADGEDDPADIPRLVDEIDQNDEASVVFAARRRRSEGLTFKIFYALYRSLHVLLTGIPVNVGNFSIVRPQALRSLVVVSELWNHYAAAVFRSRLRYAQIATTRKKRLVGVSRMNFVALVNHGLSALAVHGEVVGVRLLLASIVPFALSLGTVLLVASIRLFTSMAIPGWASIVVGLSFILLTQVLMLAVLFTFFALSSRASASFIPIRDYLYFVDSCARVVGARLNPSPSPFQDVQHY